MGYFAFPSRNNSFISVLSTIFFINFSDAINVINFSLNFEFLWSSSKYDSFSDPYQAFWTRIVKNKSAVARKFIENIEEIRVFVLKLL